MQEMAVVFTRMKINGMCDGFQSLGKIIIKYNFINTMLTV